jgi:predicted DNA-binding transcriptional regulator AlpA
MSSSKQATETIAEDAEPMNESLRYVPIGYVTRRFGLSPSSVWKWVRAKKFPKGTKFGPHITRWRVSDLDEWERAQRKEVNT